MKALISKRVILIKLHTLAFKSIIGFVLGIFLSCSTSAKNPTFLVQNHSPKPVSPLLLSADELIYNRDENTVSAQGNVQIEYNGNKVVAQKVTYNQKTGRIIAQGNVEIVQKDGNKIYSNQIDMTKDFGEGFVNALRIDTATNIHFAATSATRRNNQITIFDNATYTACEPCSYKPERDVLWKIKARKIIWNSVTKKIQFENSRFEVFGVPIAQLPTFELYDPTIRRASGFLAPHFFYADYLGMGIKNSYFWNLAPHYDLTLSSTLYSQQGLLTEGEWRQRFQTGNYNIRFAHIYQLRPQNFDNDTIDAQHKNRYMLATKGDFRLNSRWTYGWDILAQSDRHFSRVYKLENYRDPTQLSQLYLNGLAGKNHFDMRFYHFKVQDLILNDPGHERHSRQAWVLPQIDYSFTPDESIYIGLLTFHSNMQSVYRHHTDFSSSNWNGHPLNTVRLSGIAGNSFRLTNELEWKKRFTMHGGLILTPLLSLRADIMTTNMHDNENAHITNDPLSTVRGSALRGMATAGLELRYPFLITFDSSTHIIEPTAQIFIRNNEQYIGQIPNEDAQSFVFDATTLFQRDKFSGYDRVEGGTRANIGLRYSGNFNNDWSLYGVIGQSFHLAGKNSFAEKDFVNVGIHSSLEATRSDYVAMFGANHKSGFFLEARGRFDKKTGEIHRSEIEASQKWQNFEAAVQYAYIASQPDYEYPQERQEISFQTGIKLTNSWSISSNASYDLISDTFVKRGISLRYADECFGLTFGYQQVINLGKKTPLQNFNFSLSLRTIADIGKKTKLDL
ncbi:Organic solvent tolerance protein [Bartonella henselae]|uniref:LPS-assembly protein LptD n=2 Tax=Bartonella TaxID=773 RepID=X5MF20_BARHN|nr:LPS-assembly protein LptD [Bartonella henselae]MDM9996323.1 LPS-assembly protein LptD [Bartonella henselae]OLL48403.1 Organic solvent tolerance protein [Bartonella henselae]OLL48731.1 Organic solvent tolerance protein [Bartonella henselae]OLL49825.1 Organic solvent tolerance protein [Bartonella henselae]OLL57378.1 Organic solvent tolerance protein [Bartonella henselae]